MFISRQNNRTGGGFFRRPTTDLALTSSSAIKSSASSSGSTLGINTQGAALGWEFANAWRSTTAAMFGSTSLRLGEVQSSASQFPSELRNSSEIEGKAPQLPKTVLLVEDNPADVFVIREVLKECDLNSQVQLARDGHEALTYLRKLADFESPECPSLVLLDLNLPKITGLEVLSYLKSSHCSSTPVIIVTSSNAKVDRDTAQQLGARAYFQKPSSLEKYMELAELIRHVIDPKSTDRPL